MYSIRQPTTSIVSKEPDKPYRCGPSKADPCRVGWELSCTSQRRTESMCVVRLTSLAAAAATAGSLARIWTPASERRCDWSTASICRPTTDVFTYTELGVTTLYCFLCVKLNCWTCKLVPLQFMISVNDVFCKPVNTVYIKTSRIWTDCPCCVF